MSDPEPRKGARVARFGVADATVSLAAADVLEIVRPPRMTRVPAGPPALRGLANLRGIATPVFDLAELLGKAKGDGQGWVVLLNTTPPNGLLVDRLTPMSDEEDFQPGGLHVADHEEARRVEFAALFDGQAFALRQRQKTELPDLPKVDAVVQEAMVDLLAFAVADQKYALPLSEIGEVAPLSGDSATAVVRGSEIELVSLSALLGLPETANSGRERIIVLDHDGRKLGLVVDGARTILRVPESKLGAAPFSVNREDDGARIQSVLRLPDGRGVVSVLTVESLFRPGSLRAEPVTSVSIESAAISDDRVPFVIFRMGDERYGYPLEAITEIRRQSDEMASVPGAPPHIAGAINLRGNVVPILDQRHRFGAAESSGSGRIIFSDFGGVQSGLLVDGVEGIRRVEAGDVGAAPEFTGQAGRLFDRVIAGDQEERMILVVDPQELLDPNEIAGLKSVSEASQ